MIPAPSGWSARSLADGVRFLPPEGPDLGGVRHIERVRPLASARDVVAELLARDPGFAVTSSNSPRLLLTVEGEYAVRVTVRGTVGGRPTQRDFGMVYVDDFFSLVNGVVHDPARFEAFAAVVDEMVRGDVHLLGERRRWFLYDAPRGWQARARGQEADWFPLDYPQRAARISCSPTLPRSRGCSAAALVEELLARRARAEETSETAQGPLAVESDYGLTGWQWTAASRGPQGRTRRQVVVLEDQRYLYPLLLETIDLEPAQLEPLFLDVVRSVRPIPQVAAAVPGLGQLFAAWSD